jgi:glycosyltransferase 2 family protein
MLMGHEGRDHASASDTLTAASRSRTRAASLGLAILLAAVLLYYSLRGIDWREVWQILSGASWQRLVLAAAIAAAALFLRACRWRVLLNAAGDVSISSAFWATAAGVFGNNFLPARAGELVRTLMIGSRSALDNSYVLATALSERVADSAALVVISACAVLVMPAPPGWLADAARPFAILGLLGVLGIAVLPLFRSFGRSMVDRAPVPHALRPRIVTMVEQSLNGMRAFHNARRLTEFLALTVVIWCLDAIGAVITAAALGLRLPIPVAFLLIAGLGVASALPSTPGYLGVYQFAAVTVLTPFGFSRTTAIAYILVAQALAYVVFGFWGSLGLWHYRRAASTQARPV